MKTKLLSLDEFEVSLKKNKIPSFYHSSCWLRSIEESYHQKLLLLGTLKNEEVLGVLPCVLMTSKILGNKLVSLPYCEHGGPISSNKEAVKPLFNTLDTIAEKYNLDYVEIRFLPKKFESLFESNGFIRRFDYYTFILKLNKPLIDIWKSFNKKVRNNIRKARKNGVKVMEEKNKIKNFYSLYLKTMKKLGSPPHSYSFFENIFKFCPQNVKLLFAEYNGKEIAASIFFLHDKKIYYWKNVSEEKYLFLRPNDLILYEMIEWGNKNGYELLDLGRTRPNTGTYLFKKRWGGKAQKLNNFYKLYKKHEIPDPHTKKYKNIGRIWSFLPLWLINRIGPILRKNFP